MKPHCQQVAEIITTSGLGEDAFLYPERDWAVFYAREPDTPDCCITVYDTPAVGLVHNMNSTDPMWEWAAVQVRVRATSYSDAWNKIRQISFLLAKRGEDRLTAGFFEGIFIAGAPSVLPNDQNRRTLLVQNFRIAVHPSPGDDLTGEGT